MRPPQRGFTLIEVLAAMTVLALTLGGVLNAAGFYGRNAVYLQNKTVAGWIANNQMVEVQLSREWVPTGRMDGREEMAGREWFWKRTVEETPDDRLRRVRVQVRLDEADDDAWLIEINGFFAAPASGQAGIVATP